MASVSLESAKHYWAFISYSHADSDWADWLHKALEHYRIPRRLVGSPTPNGRVPPRLTPVFLDRLELAASTNLDANIAAALASSATLIVLCSPAAVASLRVTQEIETYSRSNPNRILSLIVAGRPSAAERGAEPAQECFPAALQKILAQNSKSSVPLAADVRPGKGGRQEALLKLVAGILHLNLDQLRQRDLQRRRARWLATLATFLIGMLCASALAFYAWNERNDSLRAQSRLLSQAAFERLDKGDLPGAQGIVLDVLQRGASWQSPDAVKVFQEIIAADPARAIFGGVDADTVTSVAYSPDGSRLLTASFDKSARIWDARTGAQLVTFSGHDGRIYSARYSPDGSRVVTASGDGTARLWDSRTGVQIAHLQHAAAVRRAVFSPDGMLIATASYDKTAPRLECRHRIGHRHASRPPGSRVYGGVFARWITGADGLG